MKMLIARFHTLIASWLLATVLPSNFMLGGNFFCNKKSATPDTFSSVPLSLAIHISHL